MPQQTRSAKKTARGASIKRTHFGCTLERVTSRPLVVTGTIGTSPIAVLGDIASIGLGIAGEVGRVRLHKEIGATQAVSTTIVVGIAGLGWVCAATLDILAQGVTRFAVADPVAELVIFAI